MLPPPLGLCICEIPCNTSPLNLADDSWLVVYAEVSSTWQCACEDRPTAWKSEAMPKGSTSSSQENLLQEPAYLFATGATLDHLPGLLQAHHCPERVPALVQHLERWASARCSAELATARQPLLILPPPLAEASQAPGAASLKCGHPQIDLHVI